MNSKDYVRYKNFFKYLSSIMRWLHKIVLTYLSNLIVLVLYGDSHRINNKDVKKILIVTLDYIGDYCVRTVPTIYLVRKYFQDAEISVLTGSWSSELVKTNPAIETVEIYNPGWLDRSKKKWSLLKRIKALLTLRKSHYDLIINVRGSIGVLLWYLLRPARYIVLFRDFIRMLSQLVAIDKIATWEGILKETEKEKNKFILIPQEAVDSVKNLLIAEGVDLRKKVISIHPSVHSKVKEWLPDRWAFVLDRLVNKYSAEIILCGDANSKDNVADIIRQMKSNVHNFAGKTTLLQLVALIQMSDLCVSIDSGPMHIAGLLDVPVIGLFGPNSPKICHPLTTKCRLIFKDLPCAGCDENMMRCRAECMEAITFEDAINAVDDLMSTF